MWGDRAIHQQDKSAINYVVPVILGIGITYGAFMTLSLSLLSFLSRSRLFSCRFYPEAKYYQASEIHSIREELPRQVSL